MITFIESGNRIATENFEIGEIYTITYTNETIRTMCCIGIGSDFVMFQDKLPNALFCLTLGTAETVSSIDIGGGGGSTMNYNELENKPQINGIVLIGNKTSSDLGLLSQADLDNYVTDTELTTELADYATNASVVSALASKQDTLTTPQLTAVNSGITSSLVTQIGTNTNAIAGKQDTLTTPQLTAVNSGITSSLVTQIGTNTNAIAGKQDTLTTPQLAAVNSGITNSLVNQITTNKNNILWANNYGYKNLINVTRDSIKAANPNLSWTDYTVSNHGGLSFTVNPDLSITISGKTTSSSIEFNILRRADGKTIFKEVGTYRIDGKIQAGKGMFAANRTVSGSGVRYGADEGATVTFDVSQSDLSAPVGIWYGINEGVGVIVDMTIYPMICLSTMDRTYQPYCPSNYELYQMILNL